MMQIALVVFLAQANVVSLSDAVKTALAEQPLLRQAHANTAAAEARAGQARAPLLPQLFGSGTYSRRTSNFAPGSLSTIGAGMGNSGTGTAIPGPSWNTFNYWNFGITASETLWDASGQLARWRQNVTFAEAVAATERATRLQTILSVRTAYFAAVAQKALVAVAQETLTNQQRHLQQIEGFVKVGTRPEIDLAQARTDRANAEVQLITAENNFEVQKATLNQMMGIERDTDYDVAA
jgi:outer membrane protein